MVDCSVGGSLGFMDMTTSQMGSVLGRKSGRGSRWVYMINSYLNRSIYHMVPHKLDKPH